MSHRKSPKAQLVLLIRELEGDLNWLARKACQQLDDLRLTQDAIQITKAILDRLKGKQK